MHFDSDKLLLQLPALHPHQVLWIGYSGGLDSTCLLYALSRLKQDGHLTNPIKAVYIHHGLSPNADFWQFHCQHNCQQWGIDFEAVSVNGEAKKGESPEAAAREARYQAFRERLGKGDVLFTAHHQDDQAETLLIQLLRGSGVKGLAAMPVLSAFDKGMLCRPLLNFSRQALQAYATGEHLDWIEDESNQSDAFDRNYLRNRIMPLLMERWPAVSQTLARSAAHCAEAAELLQQQAEQDFVSLRISHYQDQLPVDVVLALSPSRQRNLLRHWVTKLALPLPSAQQLQQITQNLLTAKEDGEPCVKWPGAEMRRFDGWLYLMKPLSYHDSSQEIFWPAEQSQLHIQSLGKVIQRSELMRGRKTDLTVKFRQGGERIQLPGREHHTTLKKFLQQQGIPPWMRDRLPLIYQGDKLIDVIIS